LAALFSSCSKQGAQIVESMMWKEPLDAYKKLTMMNQGIRKTVRAIENILALIGIRGKADW